MKKLVLTTFAIFTCLAFMNAQEIADNAIGLRLGDSDGFGTEISYQRALGGNNRLEVDLGWRSGNNYDGFKLAGLYQWVWQLVLVGVLALIVLTMYQMVLMTVKHLLL